MSEKIHELDIKSLDSVSGGVNKIVQFHKVNTQEELDNHLSKKDTVIKVSSTGTFKLTNGQIVQFNEPGYYCFY